MYGKRCEGFVLQSPSYSNLDLILCSIIYYPVNIVNVDTKSTKYEISVNKRLSPK
jgi:hypothetical protein